mgnify:CR=1 FL=1|jgi:Cu(I)/Ag(I) efflux system periplasmic protein CusF|tara:strand:- start:1403 stop:1666 length:264 start_codon:yes stop_codon:yes gene_type:complete
MNKLLVSTLAIIVSFSATSILAEQNMNHDDMENMAPKAETTDQQITHSAIGTVLKSTPTQKKSLWLMNRGTSTGFFEVSAKIGVEPK